MVGGGDGAGTDVWATQPQTQGMAGQVKNRLMKPRHRQDLALARPEAYPALARPLLHAGTARSVGAVSLAAWAMGDRAAVVGGGGCEMRKSGL